MTLAFLRVNAASGTARSPVASVAAAGGATIALRDGWQVPASFGDPEAERLALTTSVGVCDASPLGKADVRGAHDDPLGLTSAADGLTWCPVTPARRLALGPAEAIDALVAASADAIDVTSAYAALVIAGPLARETIARFCALDLREQTTPVGGVRPGSIARTPGVVVREASDRYLLLIGAAVAEYVWDVAVDAATQLGGRAAGTDALQGVRDDA